MKHFLSLASVLLLVSGCSLVAPYSITFTNTPGAVVDPLTSTLDFVVSEPTSSYISKVECEGAEAIELLPIVADSKATSTLHKLPLTVLKDMPEGSVCEVTVTVFDPTTTETASQSISVTMPGTPAGEEEEEDVEEEDEEETSEETEESSEEDPSTSVEASVDASAEETSEPLDPLPTDPNEPTDPESGDPAAPAGTEEPGA